MLTDLNIKNFAIIDNLHVSFRSGLNILTGETGAGKSIIIDAVSLILGARASADLVRGGEEEAVVEAVFDISLFPSISAMLSEMGIDTDGELLVKRVVSRSGKNRVFLNGGLSTIAILSEASRELINIYGQHEAQTLLKPEQHLTLLDGYAGLSPMRKEYAILFGEHQRILEEIKRLESGEREASHRLDLLSFQSKEIGEAALLPDEEDALLREHVILSHAEKLFQKSRAAFEGLYGAEPSILGLLAGAKGDVTEIASIDASLHPISETLNSAYLQIEDAALALRDYSERVDMDPERLQAIAERLDLIHRLKRKYAPTLEEIMAYKREIDCELDTLLHRERSRGELDAALAEVEEKLLAKGAELSEKRDSAASRMKEAMENELHELAMRNALFEVSFTRYEEPHAMGLERVEFLFTPNPGEPPKPLSRIASGGELSRLMLALKQIHPESDVPTLVFDEVDTGIGGATSALVGAKLKRVSRCQQVLCITHLPQVAAFADHHFLVEKGIAGGRTVTTLSLLEGDERAAEMARMLGGTKITEKTLEHAREMIDEARK